EVDPFAQCSGGLVRTGELGDLWWWRAWFGCGRSGLPVRALPVRGRGGRGTISVRVVPVHCRGWSDSNSPVWLGPRDGEQLAGPRAADGRGEAAPHRGQIRTRRRCEVLWQQ